MIDLTTFTALVILPANKTAPSSSGLGCHPVTVEIVGSNPIGVAN